MPRFITSAFASLSETTMVLLVTGLLLGLNVTFPKEGAHAGGLEQLVRAISSASDR